MRRKLTAAILAASAALAISLAPAQGADLVKVANSQKGFWDQTLIEFGNRAGIFKKHDIDLEILWTDGGADAQQAVISGSMDIGLGTGALGVISAYAKGAPIDIISATMTGSSDLFWYVKAASPIKSFKDTDGKTVSYSRPGSSSNLIASALVDAANTKAKLVPVGGPAAAMTQVMSDQVDVGWSAVPVGLDRVESGETRIIASGNDAPGVKQQTVRVIIANRNFLQQHADVVKRFMEAYQETLDWAYTSDDALKMWAEMQKIDVNFAKRARERGYPREALQLYPIQGMEKNVAEAVEYGRLKKPMTAEEIAKMLKPANDLKAAIGK